MVWDLSRYCLTKASPHLDFLVFSEFFICFPEMFAEFWYVGDSLEMFINNKPKSWSFHWIKVSLTFQLSIF